MSENSFLAPKDLLFDSSKEERKMESEAADVEYIENIIEVPNVRIEKRIKKVPKIHYIEKIVEQPKIIHQDRIVEIPQIEYKDVVVERVVEVEQFQDRVITEEVFVPQHVDKVYEEVVDVPHEVIYKRHVPFPIVHNTDVEIEVSKFHPKKRVVKVPVKIPRFVEVPVPRQLLDESLVAEAERLRAKVQEISNMSNISNIQLSQIQNVAEFAAACEFPQRIETSKDLVTAFKDYLQQPGSLPFPTPMTN